MRFCVKSSEDASTHVAIRPRTDGQMTARILCARSRDHPSSDHPLGATAPGTRMKLPNLFFNLHLAPTDTQKLGFSAIGNNLSERSHKEKIH